MKGHEHSYALGYAGHGVAMATHLGKTAAEAMLAGTLREHLFGLFPVPRGAAGACTTAVPGTCRWQVCGTGSWIGLNRLAFIQPQLARPPDEEMQVSHSRRCRWNRRSLAVWQPPPGRAIARPGTYRLHLRKVNKIARG